MKSEYEARLARKIGWKRIRIIRNPRLDRFCRVILVPDEMAEVGFSQCQEVFRIKRRKISPMASVALLAAFGLMHQ